MHRAILLHIHPPKEGHLVNSTRDLPEVNKQFWDIPTDLHQK